MWDAAQPEHAARNSLSSKTEANKATRTDVSYFLQALLRLPAFQSTGKDRRIRLVIIGQLAAVAITAVATAARFQLDPFLPPGFPYLTFFPCVVITGFIWGLSPALTCAILSGLAAWYWFIPPFGGFTLTSQSVVALLFYFVVVGIDLILLQLALYTVRSQVRTQMALRQALDFQEMVSGEADHRLKNLFATVNGLIALSQKYAATPAELASQLRERIGAMAHSVALIRGAAHGTNPSLSTVVTASLRALGTDEGERITFDGGDTIIDGRAIVPLNLIFHELGTNSLKYGALSSDAGTVGIAWNVLASASSGDILRLVWTERNGSAAVEPTRSGFGTVLINRMSQSLGGGCDFSYLETGLVVTIVMDSAGVLAGKEAPDQSI